jgi:sugar (pentulose or hexulose) kinase
MDAVGENFKSITGMRPRPSLPYMNALHFFRQNTHLAPSVYKMISLPEWIAFCHNESFGIAHNTMQAGTGFYDVNHQAISSPLLSFFEAQTGAKIEFNLTVNTIAIAGYYLQRGQKIPIYAGVGDLQCALLGAGINEQMISINVGTGSQVSRLNCDFLADKFERRPFFNNKMLYTQTHMPAGRALNEYMHFLEETCWYFCQRNINAWDACAALTKEDILSATLQFDLNVFKSAYAYETGGKILHIHEGQFNVKNYLASLLKSLLLQYIEVAEKMSDSSITTYVCSGGITRKLPVLAETLTALTGKNINIASSFFDETFLGLQTVATKFML